MAEGNAALPPDRRIAFRIGVNMGDIVVEDGDIFGDGVNVAARLEGLAEPGGICVSARVQEDAAGRFDLAFVDMGDQALKNIARPVRTYRVVPATGPASVRASSGPPLPDKPSIAVLPFANRSAGQRLCEKRQGSVRPPSDHAVRRHRCRLPDGAWHALAKLWQTPGEGEAYFRAEGRAHA